MARTFIKFSTRKFSYQDRLWLGDHYCFNSRYNKQELVIKTSHQVFAVTWCEGENDFFTQLGCKI